MKKSNRILFSGIAAVFIGIFIAFIWFSSFGPTTKEGKKMFNQQWYKQQIQSMSGNDKSIEKTEPHISVGKKPPQGD